MAHTSKSSSNLDQSARNFERHCRVNEYNQQHADEPPWRFEVYDEPELGNVDLLKTLFLSLISLFIASALTFIGFAGFSDDMPGLAWWALVVAIVSGAIIALVLNSREHMVMRLHRELPPEDPEESDSSTLTEPYQAPPDRY